MSSFCQIKKFKLQFQILITVFDGGIKKPRNYKKFICRYKQQLRNIYFGILLVISIKIQIYYVKIQKIKNLQNQQKAIFIIFNKYLSKIMNKISVTPQKNFTPKGQKQVSLPKEHKLKTEQTNKKLKLKKKGTAWINKNKLLLQDMINEQYKEDFQDVDLDKARKEADSLNIVKFNPKTQKYEKLPLNCKLSELQDFGSGVQLYFYFLKYFAVVFFVIFLINLYTIIKNYSQNGMGASEENTSILLKTTFANIPSRISLVRYTESIHNDISKTVYKTSTGQRLKICPSGQQVPEKHQVTLPEYPGTCFIDRKMRCYELKFKKINVQEKWVPGDGSKKLGFKSKEQDPQAVTSSTGTKSSTGTSSTGSTDSTGNKKSTGSTGSTSSTGSTGSKKSTPTSTGSSGSKESTPAPSKRLLTATQPPSKKTQEGINKELSSIQTKQIWAAKKPNKTSNNFTYVKCGSQKLQTAANSASCTNGQWCTTDNLCLQLASNPCFTPMYPDPESSNCRKEGNNRYYFSMHIFFYKNLCPSDRADYVSANPKNSTWPSNKNYSDYVGQAPAAKTATQLKNMYSDQELYVWLDFGSIMVFLLAIWYYIRTSYKISQQNEADVITTADYSIYVKGFSKKTSPEELRKHFEKYGKVIEVEMVKDVKGTFFQFLKLSKIKYKHMLEIAKIKKVSGSKKTNEKYKKEYDNLYEKLKSLPFFRQENIYTMEDIPNLSAFIIFDKLQDKQKLQETYKKLNAFSFCTKTWPEQHIFQGKKIKIDFNPEDPSNIRWENLDVSWLEASSRKFIVNLILASVFLVTIMFLIFYKQLKKSQSVLCGQLWFNRQDLTSIENGEDSLKYCFCDYMHSKNYGSTVQNKTSTVYTEYKSFCDIWTEDTYSQYLGYFCALLIIVMNKCVAVINAKLTAFSRYKTRNMEQQNVASKQFLYFLINTAIVPFCVSFRFEGFIPAHMSPFSHRDSESNYSDDLNRAWYTTFGDTLMLTMFYSWAQPPIWVFVNWLTRKLKLMNIKQAKVQKQAKDIFTKPEFKLHNKLVPALMILYVCFMLSCGMPILTLAICVFFALKYFFDKYTFLRQNSRPNKIDSTINLWVIQKLHEILIFKIIFSVLMLTVGDLFDPPQVNSSDAMSSKQARKPLSMDRTSNKQCQWVEFHKFLFFFAILYLILDVYIWKLYVYCKSQYGSEKMHFNKNQGTFTEEIDKIKASGISTYNLTANEEYKLIHLAFIEFVVTLNVKLSSKEKVKVIDVSF